MFYSCKFLLQVTFERKLFSLVLVRFALTNRCSPVSCLLKVVHMSISRWYVLHVIVFQVCSI